MGEGFALTAGHAAHGVAIFAEALGEDEALQGTPLVGRAGGTFNRMLSRTEDPDFPGSFFKRPDFLLGNVINCRPPNNFLSGAPYEEEAIRHCTPYLKETLSAAKPRVIFTMGNQPLKRFTGHWGIDSLRGYVFDTPHGLVVGSYHPSFIQRGNWDLVRVWQLDLQKAVQLARGRSFARPKSYITHPTPAEAWAFYERFIREPWPFLSFDIETPYSKTADEKDEEWVSSAIEDDPSYTILRISFSFKPFEAISMPWWGPFIEVAKKLLAHPGAKLTWNGRAFDVPRLVFNGAPVNGRMYDGMDAWHFLEPPLRMGLKYVATFFCPDMQAWKLESASQPEWYSAADSDVALRCFLATKDRLTVQGRWDIFERHVVDLTEVLKGVTQRGINVDVATRSAKREEFERRFRELVERLQPSIPLQARPLSAPYTLTEEDLKKRSLWKDGRMRQVRVTLSPLQVERMEKRLAAQKRKEEAAARKLERAIAREQKKALREEEKLKKAASSAEKKLLSLKKKLNASAATTGRRKSSST